MRVVRRFLAAIAACVIVGFACGQVTYSLTDLGTLPGGGNSFSWGLNASGQVAGYAYFADGSYHAFLYSGGLMSDLGTLGGKESEGFSINSFGQVVGTAAISDLPSGGPYHAFLYSGGVMSDLGTLGGPRSDAYGINDSGQIVGRAYTVDILLHAFLYSDGEMSDLGTLGGTDSVANCINALGQIAGQSANSGGQEHAFLYSGGVVADLGTLGGATSEAGAINSFGQVVGDSNVAGDASFHAFLYSGGVMNDLGTFGGSYSWAYGINDSGQVLGWSTTDAAGDGAPYLYTGGVMYNLNAMLDSSAAGYTLGSIEGINNAGQIAGSAWNAALGQWRAVLLTPDAGVAGSVSLGDFTGDATKVPIEIEIREAGTTIVLQRQTVNLQADGTFSVPSALVGTYDVAAKGPHWLRRRISNVVLTGSGFVAGLSFSLVNGDVNGDNNINLADAAAISLAWRTKPGDPKYNASADLNGDGSINVADAAIVAKNWRKSGDP